jgi:hypothetical protein
MSVEIVNGNNVSLGQFASNKGYSDLIAAVDEEDGYNSLKAFLEAGMTKDVVGVGADLLSFSNSADKEVAMTAVGLERLLRGQKIAVMITDGSSK